MGFASERIDLGAGHLAEEDLTGAQYHVVKIGTADYDILEADSGDNPIGVLQNAPDVGQPATVTVLGISKVVCGGTVTRGLLVEAEDGGKIINSTATKEAVGIALASGVDGDIIEIVVNPDLLNAHA